MKPEPQDTPPRQENRVSLNDRRKYLVQQLAGRGILSYARYSYECGNPSSATIKEDLRFLEMIGFDVFTIEVDGKRYLVDSSHSTHFTKVFRSDKNRASKEAIGLTSASLLLGIPEERNDQINQENPQLSLCTSREQLEKELRKKNGQLDLDRLIKKLEDIWKEESTTVYIDAGTTNDRLGLLLRELRLPACFSGLRRLNVCTNSPSIFDMLGEPEISIQTIMIGGTQFIPSQCFAGVYSQLFMTSLKSLLRFSISFMGATSVDLERRLIYSDSFAEQDLKCLAMENSSVRVVCVDLSKISLQPTRLGAPFSNISSDQIDLIITNQPDGDSDKENLEKIEMIRDMGVPVLEAMPPSKTMEKRRELERGAEVKCRIPWGTLENFLGKLNYSDKDKDDRSRIPQSYIIEILVNAVLEKIVSEDDGQTPISTDNLIETIQKELRNFETESWRNRTEPPEKLSKDTTEV